MVDVSYEDAVYVCNTLLHACGCYACEQVEKRIREAMTVKRGNIE